MERLDLPVRVFATRAAAEQAVAAELAAYVRSTERPVLGLATGTTPVGIYAELARTCATGELDFARAETFNLDEYHGVPPEHPGSFHAFMRAHLLDAAGLRVADVNAGSPGQAAPAGAAEFSARAPESEREMPIAPGRAHLLRGDVPLADVPAHCAAYEAAIRTAGGIGLQLLGIGANGHVAFNEPGSPRDSRTRRVELAESTRAHYAASFGGDPPTHALTMGIATILEARRLLVVAFGAAKAEIVARALSAPSGPELPATFLREHPRAELVLDAAAAARLDRGAAP